MFLNTFVDIGRKANIQLSIFLASQQVYVVHVLVEYIIGVGASSSARMSPVRTPAPSGALFVRQRACQLLVSLQANYRPVRMAQR